MPIEEYPQNAPNCTRTGQVLFDLLNGSNIRLYAASDMREQALHAVAIENPRASVSRRKRQPARLTLALDGDGMCCGDRARQGRSRAHDRV